MGLADVFDSRKLFVVSVIVLLEPDIGLVLRLPDEKSYVPAIGPDWLVITIFVRRMFGPRVVFMHRGRKHR